VVSHWLKPGGRLIIGIDYYSENEPSTSWNKECGISIMTRLSEAEWLSGFNSSGLIDVLCWRVGAKDDWAGTLVVTGLMHY
jgi:hypothetical protein